MFHYKNEGLYIAGPECFYQNGYELWWAQRKLAEYYGIPVVLPTSTPLKLDNDDLALNAKEIFDDLIDQVKKTTAIIADLEFFRGSEPDGGTIFEMGWIWQKGGRVYGYTRDKRSMAEKNQAAYLSNGIIIDQDGRELPYSSLPFAPSIMASGKVIEGDFKDALKLYLLDLEDERRGYKRIKGERKTKEKRKNRVFIATSKRYDKDYIEYKERIRLQYEKKGFEAVFPSSGKNDLEVDPLLNAEEIFEENMSLLSSSSYIVADLDNYHGFEPNNDVSFECGVAWGMGINCIGFMKDCRIMKERIPHYSEKDGGRDWCGNTVENFNLPINLMFSTYFHIVKGDAEDALCCL